MTRKSTIPPRKSWNKFLTWQGVRAHTCSRNVVVNPEGKCSAFPVCFFVLHLNKLEQLLLFTSAQWRQSRVVLKEISQESSIEPWISAKLAATPTVMNCAHFKKPAALTTASARSATYGLYGGSTRRNAVVVQLAQKHNQCSAVSQVWRQVLCRTNSSSCFTLCFKCQLIQRSNSPAWSNSFCTAHNWRRLSLEN